MCRHQDRRVHPCKGSANVGDVLGDGGSDALAEFPRLLSKGGIHLRAQQLPRDGDPLASVHRLVADVSSDGDGTIASGSWDFGDGTTSTLASPSHIYTADGVYPVVLTVTDDHGDGHIYAHDPRRERRAARWGVVLSRGPVDMLPGAFTDASVDLDGSSMSRVWSFGDGATSTSVDPSPLGSLSRRLSNSSRLPWSGQKSIR